MCSSVKLGGVDIPFEAS